MPDRPVQDAREFTVGGQNAASSVRAAFDEAAYGWLDPGLSAEARLLLGELADAVVLQHGRPTPIDVRLRRIGPRGVRAEVSIPTGDGRRPVRAFRLVAGHRAQVLDALTDAWGIVHEPGAPYVWFELGDT